MTLQCRILKAATLYSLVTKSFAFHASPKALLNSFPVSRLDGGGGASRYLSSQATEEPGKKELPSDYPNIDRIIPALSAIRKACRITMLLQPNTVLSSISGITKSDTSPVTIGDFAAQAIVLNILNEAFDGQDIFVAEEGSSNLVSDKGDLSNEILDVFKKCGLEEIISDAEDLKRSIDLGQTYTSDGKLQKSVIEKQELYVGSDGKKRTWCLDPIDGTRGFLRGKREGGQYCIALALMEDGVPTIGILACPNLPSSTSDDNYEWLEDETEANNILTRGCIFVASRGGGCYQLPLFAQMDIATNNGDESTVGANKINVTQNDGNGSVPLNQARFCIGVEKYGDPEGKVSAIAKKIHGELDESGDILSKYTRRMDSQVKYGVAARGGAEIITRLPKKSYVEWIWDHAAGRVVIEEAGGLQTDVNGDLIDYGKGAKMDPDVDGILISSGGLFHKQLLKAYKEQEAER